MTLVELKDFKGFHTLARSTENDLILQAYIDRYEDNYIKFILGATLGQLFIDDLSNPTRDPIFVVIEDAFIQDDTNSVQFNRQINVATIRESKGMKDVLTSLIYYNFVFDTQTKHAQAGVTLGMAEVSNINSPENAGRFAEEKWNDALSSVDAIQWFVSIFKPEDYPTYNGQEFGANYSAIV